MSSVQDYYDHNTRRFLRLGQHDGTRNIHQPLWPDGVESLEVAVNHSNALVLRELEAVRQIFAGQSLHVLDLGCGVGACVFYLAQHFGHPANFLGITISAVQAGMAQRMATQDGKSACQFVQGDFQALPELPAVHLAYSIEAFVHATDATSFFAQAASALAPGARLVIIDDFLTPSGEQSSGAQERAWLADFQRNWFANSLMTETDAQTLAQAQGLRLLESEDLTPYMRIGRPRDTFIGIIRRVAGPLVRRSLYLRALSGGYAKQQCIKSGLVQYRRLVFERDSAERSKPATPAHSPRE